MGYKFNPFTGTFDIDTGLTSAAPTDATYVTLTTNANLTNERVLTGTANQVVIADNGAGSTVVLSLPQDIHTGASPIFTDLTLSGGDLIASVAATFNVFNTVATTINAFGAATVISFGAASTVITLGANATINGGSAANNDLTLQGTSNATRTTSYVNLQPNGGNVGIGTATPRVAFDLVSANNTPFILQKTSSTGFSISSYWPTLAFNMYHDGSTWRGLGSGYTAILNDNPDTGVMSFSIRDASASAGADMGNYVGVERLAISRVGHVGIGTTTFTGRLNVDNQAVAVSIARFLDNGTLMHEFADGGGVVFNENGNAVDFRVESDTNTNMLFVDGTNNRVGIGDATPDYVLDVAGAIGTDGKIELYNAIATEGWGVPSIHDQVALTAQTADITATNFSNCGTAGQYEVEYYMEDTAADVTAGTLQLTIAFTDDAGSTTVTSAALPLTAVGRTSGRIYIRLASGNITYSTAVTGIYGTSQYALYMTAKRVN